MSNNVFAEDFLPSRMINVFFILLLLVVLFIVFAIIDLNIVQLCSTIMIFLLCTVWGHVVIHSICYKDRDILSGLVWGSIAGITISSLIISIIVYLIGWNISVIFISITGIPAIILLFQLTKTNRQSFSHINNRLALTIILVALFIVTAFFIFPYKNLGVLVDDKYLYAWLFGHDFINRMIHVESLSRGIPLISMTFEGEYLSYYWLAYVFPSLLHNLNFISLEIKQILQISLFLYSVLVTAALILFLRKYIHEKKILIISVILALCCYSYVWVLNTGRSVLIWLSDYIPIIPDEAIMNFSGFAHGMYRFFLVEPQGVMFIALMLMILTLYSPRKNMYAFVLTGFLLGLSFGVEAVNGIMLMLWFGGVSLFYLIVMKNERSQVFFKHFIAVSCALLVYAILFSVEMYSLSTGQRALQLSPNWFAIKAGILYFPIAYGPPFILGFAGLILILKKREALEHWVYSYVILLGVALFFVFFIQNPTEYHFGLLKATRVIPICLIMLSIYFLQSHLNNKRLGISISFLIAISLPTLITDNRIASDISNPSTFLRISDMEAAEWIKDNLPKDAVIQAEPNYPGPDDAGSWSAYAYSFIPIFAERITAVGEWKVSHQAHEMPDEVGQRYHEIKRMYSTANVHECIEILRKLNINFIYVGELEKQEYPEGINKFENKRYFESIYHNTSTSIYRLIE